MQFDRHTFVLLVRPPDAPELTPEESAAVQDVTWPARRSCTTRAISSSRGHSTVAGPFDGQDDERLRGIAIMSVDAEHARRLYADDPAVRAGRLAVEVMTWLVPAGSVRFEKVRAPRSMAEANED